MASAIVWVSGEGFSETHQSSLPCLEEDWVPGLSDRDRAQCCKCTESVFPKCLQWKWWVLLQEESQCTAVWRWDNVWSKMDTSFPILQHLRLHSERPDATTKDTRKHKPSCCASISSLLCVWHAVDAVATEQGHEADADGKQGAEAQAHVLPIDGQRCLAVASSVTLRAVAGEFGGWLRHTGPPVARPSGTEGVDTGLPGPVHTDHVARRTSAKKSEIRSTGKSKPRGSWTMLSPLRFILS